MKLLTAEITDRLPRLYATENVPLEDKTVICKFFDPTGRATWYVFEGDREDGDWRFFGFVVSPLGEDCDELGYFCLSELASIVVRGGLRIERDINFTPVQFSRIQR